MKTYLFNILIFSLFLSSGCFQKDDTEQNTERLSSKESLVKANRYMVKAENQDIENYIQRHGWEMHETGSGLSIMIHENGEGELAAKGQVVELDYELSLITGDIVYSSDESGPMVFKIGFGGVESGLEEAILLMRKGDKAKLVIPSHLAHGFMGDQKKIPPRSTVIYDIELINLK